MKFNIVNNITSTFHRVGFKAKKYSPEILIVTGIVGVVSSAILACRATTKLNNTLDDAKKKVEDIHADEKLSEKEVQTELAKTYIETAGSLAKMYAPAVILGGLSITAIVSSNNILRNRNIAIAAAYTAVDKSFKNYRDNVIDRFGKDVDRELKYNVKKDETEIEVLDENGTVASTETQSVETVSDDLCSPYAKFYDDGCVGWCKDPELNLMFLRRQQEAANRLLKARAAEGKRRGCVFLNEVYDMLGIPRTKAGQIVGWIYDENCPVGDNYIDFGIYDTNRRTNRDFVNGYERTILLDFNVDGNILDLM